MFEEKSDSEAFNVNRKVTILGAGAFGTSIATILANNGFSVSLWCYEPELVNQINIEHENKLYLGGLKLDNNIIATNNLEEALLSSEIVFQAIPVKFLRTIFEKIKTFINKKQIIVSLSKGIEDSTSFLPSQIINEILGSNNSIATLAGPNFAKEIAEKRFTSSVIASEDQDSLRKLSYVLNNDYFWVEQSNDIIGVQVGAALKNVISLLIGLSNGFGLSNNTIAYFITKSFKELTQVVELFGGNRLTSYGLSGFGDLYLSSTSTLGRNLRLGKEIGIRIKECSFDNNSFFKNKNLPESINSIVSLNNFIVKKKIVLNYLSIPYQLIFENKEFSGFLK